MILLAALLLQAADPAVATPVDPVLARKVAFAAWRICVDNEARRLSLGPDAADLVAIAAMDRCDLLRQDALERAAATAGVTTTSPIADSAMARLDQAMRAHAITAIVEARVAAALKAGAKPK